MTTDIPRSVCMAELLEDWVTIWQSELAALAADQEVQERVQRLIEAWGAQARVAAHAAGSALDAARAAGPVPPAGATPAAAADGGLLDRLAELERRLDRLERR